jgi:lipopolysaccharide transport system ATP-binding protein
MSHPSVAVEGLSKRYVLGQLHTNLLSERLGNILRRHKSKETRDELWALRDVSFEVQEGEVLGIIGRNGAGKSTLLKILSRITAPTAGRALVLGRLASLLEVGTGFHPELTGRENIYLNGTILGMRRREIDRKFDEIVAFSEVEGFLDTPIKHYSSGMHIRLAFAVAAHLETDVLVIDEVLAVGDREFQEKCLGRMNSIAKEEGRTVLFVSHNLDAISRICTEGLYLRSGRVALRGSIEAAVEEYLAGGGDPRGTRDLAGNPERWGDGRVRITQFELRHAGGAEVGAFSSGRDYDLVISFAQGGASDLTGVIASIALADARGVTVLLVSSAFSKQFLSLSAGGGQIVCRVTDLNLAAGTYSVTLFLGHRNGEVFDCLNDVRTIDVVGGDYFGTGHPGYPAQCKTLTRSTWSVE